ncbi:hypothetical protein KIPB_014228, partial [Kipferlia bialata]|eukprot:g14228.t1
MAWSGSSGRLGITIPSVYRATEDTETDGDTEDTE